MGGKLMKTFLNNLKELGVPAVHLGVSSENTNAIGYYRHLGFHEIQDYVFGMHLNR